MRLVTLSENQLVGLLRDEFMRGVRRGAIEGLTIGILCTLFAFELSLHAP